MRVDCVIESRGVEGQVSLSDRVDVGDDDHVAGGEGAVGVEVGRRVRVEPEDGAAVEGEGLGASSRCDCHELARPQPERPSGAVLIA